MGQSKALLDFGDAPMLHKVLERVRPAVQEIVLVAAPDQPLPEPISNCIVVRDQRPRRGPLEGLRVGLAALQKTCDACFVTSCDAPLLVPQVIPFLVGELGECDAVVIANQRQLHPLTAIYRTSLHEIANRLLDLGESRLSQLISACNARILDTAKLLPIDPNLDSLKNLNTPEELAVANVQAGK
jgi:molybdenum cofactor guanylyltransferase